MPLPNVAKGDPHVAAHNAERQAINQLEAMIQEYTGYETLPPGTTLMVHHTGSFWPGRPTDREDIYVHWVGSDKFDAPTAALPGDIWDREL